MGGDLDFEFGLANELKMTVAQLRNEMSAQEFMQWQIWHGRKRQHEELEQRKASGKGRR